MADPTLTVTPEVIKEDGKNRVAKTAGQSAVATAAIVVGKWIAHQCGWHGELPADVALQMGTLLTALAAVATNIGKLKGRT